MSFWSVVQTQSQYEHVVRLMLMRGRPKEGMPGYETYMPRIRYRGRIAPLFPTYIFVHIVDFWYPVRWTPGVVRLLMAGDQPAKVPETFMNDIRKREHGGFVKLPTPEQLKKGQQVRIVRGSFEGQIGLYEGMSGKDRERVLLELLGQKVPVELPGTDIAPLHVAS